MFVTFILYFFMQPLLRPPMPVRDTCVSRGLQLYCPLLAGEKNVDVHTVKWTLYTAWTAVLFVSVVVCVIFPKQEFSVLFPPLVERHSRSTTPFWISRNTCRPKPKSTNMRVLTVQARESTQTTDPSCPGLPAPWAGCTHLQNREQRTLK